MKKNNLLKALCIDDSFTIDKLNILKKYSANTVKNDKYTNLIELFSSLEREGLKSESLNETISNLKENKELSGKKSSIFDFDDKYKLEEKNDDEFNKQDKEKSTIEAQIAYLKTHILKILTILDKKKELGDYFSDQFEFEIEDDRLKNVLFILSYISSRNVSEKYILLDFRKSFQEFIETTVDNKQFDKDSLLVLKLYGQIALYLFHYKYSSGNLTKALFDFYEKEALSYLAFMIGDYFFGENEHVTKECLFFAKKGIELHFPVERSFAFNNLGMVAADLREYQLSHDVYYSWINQKKVGKVEEILSDTFLWDSKEEEWRKTDIGKRMTSVIYSNHSYVCNVISETYEYDAEQGKEFFKLACKQINYSLKLDPDNLTAHNTYGYLLLYNMNYNMRPDAQLHSRIEKKKKAIKHFSYNKSNIKEIEDKLGLSRAICLTIMELILLNTILFEGKLWDSKEIMDYYETLKSEVRNYLSIDTSSEKEPGKELSYEIKRREELKPLFSIIAYETNESVEINRIIILMISIRTNIKILKEYLHRREYISTKYFTREKECEQNRDGNKEIAYYTTLKNISHVFEELVLRDDGKVVIKKEEGKEVDSKNCLTVMNAKYMNDPSEGKVIIGELMKQTDGDFIFSGKTIEDVVNSIFSDKFVFLKSFTEQIDKLTMWNRYANDYDSDGNNSNGCCVLVDPACFVNKVEYTKSGYICYGGEFSDNYNLYRIVYLSSDGSIEKSNNPRLHKNVKVLYNNLKTVFMEMNKCMKDFSKIYPEEWESIRSIIEKLLLESLTSIMFLFKNDDYCDEYESRLILYRDRNHQNDIHLFPAQGSGDIPKLALKPYFQILINGVILGPNVRNTEKWKPYFQYQLNNMWDNHTVSGVHKDDKENYFIKKSDINYST